MSSIYAFEPKRRTTLRERPRQAGSATIIIFPGIRYERRADTAPAEIAAVAKVQSPSGTEHKH
jgi:hypothetical protein